MGRGDWWAIIHVVAESDMTENGLALPSSPYAHFTWEEIEAQRACTHVQLLSGRP